MMKLDPFNQSFWLAKLLSCHVNIVLIIIQSLMSSSNAQIGTYTLDINTKSSEGITVFYFQVKMFTFEEEMKMLFIKKCCIALDIIVSLSIAAF